MTSLTAASRPWHRAALAGILSLAAGLHFVALDQEGFGNLYYAAAVKSMLTSWPNFFFVAFDRAGFVSVDKPPLGLWMQVLSARLWGFNGWALMFPQALAGVLAVFLMYRLVRHVWGSPAGLLAALILTLTPISIAANRNNTMDSQLVLVSLAGAWAAQRAAERGHLRWLIASAAAVGLGFNIKMLQAVMVLPACFGVYLLTAPLPWKKRAGHLILASGVLALIALAWPLAVDATPASVRPYVGSSSNNTVFELIVGHNGADRLGQIGQWLGLQNPSRGSPVPPAPRPAPATLQPPPPDNGPLPQPPGPGPLGQETGSPGLGRLFNRELAGQASWWLPLSLLGAVAAAWRVPGQRPLRPEHQAVLLWLLWLIPQALFFSFAGLFHRYYLEMMAPALAALVGAGWAAAWADYRSERKPGWLLPVMLLVGAGTAAGILSYFPSFSAWLTPLVMGISVLTVTGLVLMRRLGNTQALSGVLGLGLFVQFLAPLIWCIFPLLGRDTALPFAGPELLAGAAPGQRGPQAQGATTFPENAHLVSFLNRQRHGETFLAATLNATTAAPLILETGEPVMALGGFSGGDPIVTLANLRQRIETGTVRFFFLPNAAPNARMPPGPGNNLLVQWLDTSCALIPGADWQPTRTELPAPANPEGDMRLLDCGTLR